MGIEVGVQGRWNPGVGGAQRGPTAGVEWWWKSRLSRLAGLETSGKGLTRQGGLWRQVLAERSLSDAQRVLTDEHALREEALSPGDWVKCHQCKQEAHRGS